jgi:hypothetical protein
MTHSHARLALVDSGFKPSDSAEESLSVEVVAMNMRGDIPGRIWIDSASITHIVQAFQVYPDRSQPFGWLAPTFVTSLLLSPGRVGLACGTSSGPVRSLGPIGQFTDRLLREGVVSPSTVVTRNGYSVDDPRWHEDRVSCLNATRRYIQKFAGKFRSVFSDMLGPRRSYCEGWMDWGVENAWMEHAANFNGLIDRDFKDQISAITGIDRSELDRLSGLTADCAYVRRLIQLRNLHSDYQTVYTAFLAAALVRGLYHLYIASHFGLQAAPHPLRTYFLSNNALGLPLIPRRMVQRSFAFDATIAYYLATILIHGSARERDLSSRLMLWVDNVKKMRSYLYASDASSAFNLRYSGADARQTAMDIAKRARIRTYPQDWETFVDLVCTLPIVVFLYKLESPLLVDVGLEILAGVGTHKMKLG